MRNIFKRIRSLFIKRHVIDKNDGPVKYWFKQYFYNNDIYYQSWEIHLIETKTLKDKIIVEILLGRPGLLIGKAGSQIDAITKELSEYLEKPVEIKIIEFNIFY